MISADLILYAATIINFAFAIMYFSFCDSDTFYLVTETVISPVRDALFRNIF